MLSILLSWKRCGTNILVSHNFILSHLLMLSFFLALLVSHHLSSFACRRTQTSRHLPKCSGPLWREIRRIPGPEDCVRPPTSFSSYSSSPVSRSGDIKRSLLPTPSLRMLAKPPPPSSQAHPCFTTKRKATRGNYNRGATLLNQDFPRT